MADNGAPPIRLMNFVSEQQVCDSTFFLQNDVVVAYLIDVFGFGGVVFLQLEESKKTRGPRVEDGTAQRDRPLFEVSYSVTNIVLYVFDLL